MGRTKGKLNFALNFERQINAPLDATAVVSTMADLTKEDTFISTDGNNYCYYGMLVSVTEPNNVGVYKLVNPGTGISANVAQKDSANWKIIAGEDSDVKDKIQNITYASPGETSFNGSICFGNRYYEPLDAEDNFKVNTNGALGWYVWRRVFIDESDNEVLPDSNITVTNVKLKFATGRVLTSNNISIKFSDWQYFQKAFYNRSVVMNATKTTSSGRSNYVVKYYQLTPALKVTKVDDLYQFTYSSVSYTITHVSNYKFKATSTVDPSIEVECIAQVKTLAELVNDANFAVIMPNTTSSDGTYTVNFSMATSDDHFSDGTVNITSNNGKSTSDANFIPTLNWNANPTVATINKCKLYLSNKQATVDEFTSNALPTKNLPNLFENLDNYTEVLGDFSYTQNAHYTGNLIHESHEYTEDGYNIMTLEYQPRSFGDSSNTNLVKLFSGEYGDENNNIRSWDTSLRVTTNPELGCVQIFNFSYAEGFGSVAAGGAAHAEGKGCGTYEDFSHVEGSNNINIGYGAHVEGWNNTNFGYGSHVEGVNNLCTVNGGHVEGHYNIVNGSAAHAEGYRTIASSPYQHVGGKWNIEDTANKYAFIIGNGITNERRSNAFTVSWDGDIAAKSITVDTLNLENVTFDTVTTDAINTNSLSTNTLITTALTANGILTNKSTVSFSGKYYDDTTNMVNAKGWYVWNYELFDKDGKPVSDVLMLSFSTTSAPFKVRCYPAKVDTTGAGLTGVICNWTDFNKLSTLIKSPNNGTVLNAIKTENVQLNTTSTLTYAKTFNKYEITYFDKLQSTATSTVTAKVTLYLKTTDPQFKWGDTYDCLNYNNNKTYNYSLLLSDAELKTYTTTLTAENKVFNPYLNMPNAMSKTPITDSNGDIVISNKSAITKIKFYCTDTQCPIIKWKQSNPHYTTGIFDKLTAVTNYKTLKFSYVQDAKHTDVLTNATINGNTITFDYVNERQDFASAANKSSAWTLVEDKTWKYGKDGKLRNWDGSLRIIDRPDLGVAELYPFVFAEGYENIAAGGAAHAEGKRTQAVEDFSHAEGSGSIARGYACHAEGVGSRAEGDGSHAEGRSNQALGNGSHAEGNATIVKPSAYCSHTEGYATIAASPNQHVQGMYNVVDDQRKYVDIIGWGIADTNRKNIQTTDTYGNFRTAGSIEVSDDSNVTTNQVKCWYYWGKKTVPGSNEYYLWLGNTQRSYNEIKDRGAMSDWGNNQPATLSSIAVGDILSIYNGDFYANSLEVTQIYNDDDTTTGSKGIVLQVRESIVGSDVLNIKHVEEGNISATTTKDNLPKEKYQYAVINTTLKDGKLSKLLDGDTSLSLPSNIFGNNNISYGKNFIIGNNNKVEGDKLIVFGDDVKITTIENMVVAGDTGAGATIIDNKGNIYTHNIWVKSQNNYGYSSYTNINEGNINIAQDDNVIDITPTAISFGSDAQITLADNAPNKLLTINGNVKITGDIIDNDDNILLDKIAALEARIAALETKIK